MYAHEIYNALFRDLDVSEEFFPCAKSARKGIVFASMFKIMELVDGPPVKSFQSQCICAISMFLMKYSEKEAFLKDDFADIAEYVRDFHEMYKSGEAKKLNGATLGSFMQRFMGLTSHYAFLYMTSHGVGPSLGTNSQEVKGAFLRDNFTALLERLKTPCVGMSGASLDVLIESLGLFNSHYINNGGKNWLRCLSKRDTNKLFEWAGFHVEWLSGLGIITSESTPEYFELKGDEIYINVPNLGMTAGKPVLLPKTESLWFSPEAYDDLYVKLGGNPNARMSDGTPDVA